MFKRLFLFEILLISFFFLLQCAHLEDAKQAYQNQNYKKTILLCKQAIEADSSDSEASLLLAQCYQMLNQPDSVYQTLNRHSKTILQDPNKKSDLIDLYLFVAQKAYDKNQLRRTYEAINQAESYQPDALTQQIQIAEFYYQDQQINKAKERFEAILADNPENITAKKYIEEIKERTTQAEVWVKKARASYKKGHFKTTQKQCTEALTLKPDDNDAKYYLNLAKGSDLLRRGDASNLWDAIEFFGQAMALKPERAEPHYRMAQAYEKKDEHEFINAIDSYKEALRLDPEGPFAATCKKKIKALTQRKEKLDRFWGR